VYAQDSVWRSSGVTGYSVGSFRSYNNTQQRCQTREGGLKVYDLVKAAGVDLATPAPYRALVARTNAIMDEIERILARRK